MKYLTTIWLKFAKEKVQIIDDDKKMIIMQESLY